MLNESGNNLGIILVIGGILIGIFCLIGALMKGERFTMYQEASGKKIEVKRGFSFTYLFFGFLVPLFRGHIAGFFLSFFLSIFTFGLAHLVMIFCYNNMYINWLANNGYCRIETANDQAAPVEKKPPSLPRIKKFKIKKNNSENFVTDNEPTAALKKGTVVGLSGDYKGASIMLEYGDNLSIGRDDRQCNLILSGKQISRKHCDISYDAFGDIYLITDFSTNGIFLENNERLESSKVVKLPAGSKIRLGESDHVFLLR